MNTNLLELCLSPDLGGLELYMVRAAKALDEDFNVISVINPAGKLEQYYEDTPYRYELIEKKSTLLMFGAAKRLASIIDRERIDVVHLHWTKDIPAAVMAKKLSKRKPKLVQTRNMTMTKFKNDPYHRLLYRNIDMMLPVTHQVADQLRRFIPDAVRPRIEVLYMGSDEPELLDTQKIDSLKRQHGMQRGFNVGMVGRIEEGKGQHLLIEAVAALKVQGREVNAWFVGHEMQKGYIDALKAQAKQKGIGEQVHFLGFMKNPHHFYQLCDAIVLATTCETFGLVLIEAMQVGTTVIGTNRCGPLEIIDDGVTGLLFEQNSAHDLAEKIARLSEDSKLNTSLAARGKTSAQMRFDTTKQFRALSGLLATVAR